MSQMDEKRKIVQYRVVSFDGNGTEQSEQVRSGPTEEEGIAMALDGR